VSKRINVNPDHYKVAGRQRPGEDIVHEQHKRELAMREKTRERQRARPTGKGRPKKRG
jgi:hypothetical protein